MAILFVAVFAAVLFEPGFAVAEFDAVELVALLGIMFETVFETVLAALDTEFIAVFAMFDMVLEMFDELFALLAVLTLTVVDDPPHANANAINDVKVIAIKSLFFI